MVWCMIIGYAVALSALSYASYHDVKTRLVPDAVWIISLPIGGVVSLLGILTGALQPIELASSIALSSIIGLALYALSLIGGADLFAIILIGASAPKYPDGLPILPSLGAPVVDALFNAALFSLAYPLSTLTLNVADFVRGRNPLRGVEVAGPLEAALLLLTTRRISFEELLSSNLRLLPAEVPVKRGGAIARIPKAFTGAEEDVARIIAEMRENRELYVDGVLATPTIPAIAILTIGLAMTILGNLFLSILFILVPPHPARTLIGLGCTAPAI